MIEKNKRYVRKSTKGDESIVVIKTDEEVKYHEDLKKEGFTYTEVVAQEVPGGVCTSCEG